ncbi:hypothetical protein [Phocaeicola vulgatus]|uniref:hypothetical protein n=1 Tax=Phocaeicola vulgatus TaxID=821 RepID=UPI0039B3B64F
MSHKIQLIIFFLLFSSLSLLANDNERFAGMACTLISKNRSILHSERQQKQMLFVQTVDGKELNLLCVWFPQTREDEHILDEVSVSLLKESDKILIGYGQTAGNPMFYYCLPVKQASKKMRIERWEKYRLPLSLCDFQFK